MQEFSPQIVAGSHTRSKPVLSESNLLGKVPPGYGDYIICTIDLVYNLTRFVMLIWLAWLDRKAYRVNPDEIN